MLIAIDFDDTLTADASLWRCFIQNAEKLGHRCICITARRRTDDNVKSIDDWMISHGINIPVYFTALASKIEYARKAELNVDIWIDDDPARCAIGH